MDRLKYISKASVNKNVSCLRSMFNKAIEWGIFSGKNPVKGIKFYKLDNRRTRYLEKEEIPRLLRACERQPGLRDLIEFALNTGMRKGEIFGLKWNDIDINQGWVHLLRTKNNEKREVPINSTTRDILYRLKKHPESPYVFHRDDGRPYVYVVKSFRRALRTAGITDFRFHDLRHTFASQLVMSGIELYTVKELLGHKTIEMTMRYSHLSCDHKKRAVQALCPRMPVNAAPSELSFDVEPELALSVV